LPPQSVGTWRELEQKFHAHYFSGSTEKKLIDLTTLKQRHNETPLEFLRRFREVKGMCFSLTLPDDRLADMAVVGMLPAVREKLFGMEFDNLGQLSQKLSLMSNQAYGFKKDTRFNKHHDIADIYNQFLEKADQIEEAKKMMSEVHDGICGAHQSAYRMKWVIRQAGCFLADDVGGLL
jgi:hypothetical protein